MFKAQKIDRSNYLFDNRALVALIIPLIIEQFLAVLVGIADGAMVARVGEAAMSGVSLVDSIMVLMINLLSALATGGAVVAGQYLGQKKQEDACKAATQLVWFMGIAATIVMIIMYIAKNLILQNVFGEIEADVMEHANIYFLIVVASVPFLAIYNAGAAIFRSMGNSKVSMIVSLIMNVINVTGNAILILGFHRGTEGVAIPTLVSRMVSAILIVVLLCDQSRLLHIEKTWKFRFNWKMIKGILRIGVPNGMESSMFQLGKVIVLSLVSSFGTHAIAANAASNNIAMFQMLPGLATSLAMTTVISRCVGAGDYEQVTYYTKKLIGISYLGMLVTNTFILAILPQILSIYDLEPVTEQMAEQILIFHGIMGFLLWSMAFVLPATFRAAGDVKACMIISITSMWIFRIMFSYILGKYMGIGVFGVWVAMIIDWIFRIICFLIRYKSGKWKKKAIV